jgi:hypothetical protein
MAEPAFATTPAGQVPCTYHPEVQTGLRCSRCGKPICPKCAVRTPVGLRCPDCAGVRGLPTIRTDADVLVKAAAYGLAVAAFVTLAWYLWPEWKFYLALALGFGVAEAMARVARGKRGRDLQVAAIAIVTLSAVVLRALLAWKYDITWEQIQAGQSVIVADDGRLYQGPAHHFVQLRIVPDLLFLALAYAIVWVRFR